MKALKNNKGITLIETLFAAIALAIMATAMYPSDNSTQIAANVQAAVDVHNAALTNRENQVAGAFSTLDGIVNGSGVVNNQSTGSGSGLIVGTVSPEVPPENCP